MRTNVKIDNERKSSWSSIVKEVVSRMIEEIVVGVTSAIEFHSCEEDFNTYGKVHSPCLPMRWAYRNVCTFAGTPARQRPTTLRGFHSALLRRYRY